MTRIKGFHSSGRWDVPLRVWQRNVDRLRGLPGMSFGVYTEASRDMIEAAFRQNAPWRFERIEGPAEEIVLLWDNTIWDLEDAGTFTLSTIQIRTSKGHRLPPTTAAEGRLRHREDRRRLYLSGAHWPLRNTDRRAAAWAECPTNLAKHVRTLKQADPHAGIVHSADVNESIRPTTPAQRGRVLKVERVTGLEQVWDLKHLPPRGGTRGRELIDNAFTNLRRRDHGRGRGTGAFLLADDPLPAWDHRPFGYVLDL